MKLAPYSGGARGFNGSALSLLLTVSCSLALIPAAYCQDLPTIPVSAESVTTVKVDSSTIKPDSPSGSSTINASATTNTTSNTTTNTTTNVPAPATTGAPTAAADSPLVEPGPGEAQRTQLVLRIFKAKSQGIGIDAYLNAFAMLENSVKTGETEANVIKRVESINSSLTDQIKRSAVLKSQRPAPPVAASGFAAASSGGSGSAGGTSDLIRKLQEKYGGQIPADLKEKYGGQIPENLKDKIPSGLGGMDPNQLEDLIKKYKK